MFKSLSEKCPDRRSPWAVWRLPNTYMPTYLTYIAPQPGLGSRSTSTSISTSTSTISVREPRAGISQILEGACRTRSMRCVRVLLVVRRAGPCPVLRKYASCGCKSGLASTVVPSYSRGGTGAQYQASLYYWYNAYLDAPKGDKFKMQRGCSSTAEHSRAGADSLAPEET